MPQHQHPVVPESEHRSLRTYAQSQYLLWGTVLLIFLLAVISPASAEDSFTTQLCENPDITFTYFPATAGPYPVTAHFEAKESGCTNCQWTWTVGRVDVNNPAYEATFYYNNMLDYSFNRPGQYYVNVEVFVPDQCSGYPSTASRREVIEITGEPLGGGGACLWLDKGVIWSDPFEVSGVTGQSPDFIASAPTCINCEYSWEIFEVEDPGPNRDWNNIQVYKIRDIAIESGDIPQNYGNRMISHNFQQPGFYQLAATVRNPASCPKDSLSAWGEQTTYSYYIVTDPTAPSVVTTYPSLSVVPDITTVTSTTTTIVPGWTAQQDAISINRTFRATGDGVKELEPIYTPAPVTTSVTLSGGGTVRGGPVTTQERGLLNPSATDAASSSTTRTPGFELPLVFIAGLVVIVLLRK